MPTNSDFEAKLRTFTAKGQGKSLRTPAFALIGRNEIAQGNALGKSRHKTPSSALKGRKTSVADYSALSGLILGLDCYPGFRSAPPRAITFHPFGA